MEHSSLLPLASLLAGSCALLAAAAAAAALLLAISAWLQRPRRVAGAFRRQGIDGPPPSSFLSGNLPEMQARAAAAAVAETGGRDFEKEGFDDYCKRIFPYFDKWRKAYGVRVVNEVNIRKQASSFIQKRGRERETRCKIAEAGAVNYRVSSCPSTYTDQSSSIDPSCLTSPSRPCLSIACPRDPVLSESELTAYSRIAIGVHTIRQPHLPVVQTRIAHVQLEIRCIIFMIGS
ncbi:hypothetical protein SETIT_3G201500v2 [Setaria italica]|uniref:Uncharacterized protein n=1 Tax=Setaria italica TaxID=4555 RepID=A0A368QGY5_SETIT|nr:hypothetical protein SETIT_3G201500v2 [Setaria italica]